jgi:hypothetical protein
MGVLPHSLVKIIVNMTVMLRAVSFPMDSKFHVVMF